MEVDPSEKYNVANKHPEVLAKIAKAVASHQEKMVFAESELEK